MDPDVPTFNNQTKSLTDSWIHIILIPVSEPLITFSSLFALLIHPTILMYHLRLSSVPTIVINNHLDFYPAVWVCPWFTQDVNILPIHLFPNDGSKLDICPVLQIIQAFKVDLEPIFLRCILLHRYFSAFVSYSSPQLNIAIIICDFCWVFTLLCALFPALHMCYLQL
jgi:hypothetical protein